MAPVLLRTGLGLRGLVIVLGLRACRSVVEVVLVLVRRGFGLRDRVIMLGLRACRSVVEVVLLLLPLPLLLLLLLHADRGRRGSSLRARCF